MPLARLELTISLYLSLTPVVSLHSIPRIQYYPGIPVTLLTGSSFFLVAELYYVLPAPKNFEPSEKPSNNQKLNVIIMSFIFELFLLMSFF